ncbi:MAG: SEL1-like repeat protein [Bauldia sp.]|uniref:peptidoglycan-binding protein n=1 Tax=Bauldia sp. TaxID=2575872 RepID=UPI001DBABA45|nr:peptidoglycan-binding protein [Bauldia sp.]MCB1494690.1 SEL1-like repeat protein [Bauldia sp.]
MSWSIKVDEDARAAAQEAARQAGMSLDEWLRDAIAARAAETGSSEAMWSVRDAAAGLETLTEATAVLARRIRAMERGGGSPVSGLVDRLVEIEAALGRASDTVTIASARTRGETIGELAGMIDRLARDLDDTDESARTTIEGLRTARRGGQMDSTSGVADAIRRLDERIARMTERRPLPPSGNDSLHELRTQLEGLLAASPKPASEPRASAASLDRTLRDLEARIREAGERSERNQRGRATDRMEQDRIRRIEEKLSEIARRLVSETHARPAATARGDDSLRAEIAEIVDRQGGRARSGPAPDAIAPGALRALRDDIARLEQRIVESAAGPMEDGYSGLVRRIEALAAEGPVDRGLLNEIRDELGTLGAAARGTAREATLLDRFDDLVRRLSDGGAVPAGLAREDTMLDRFAELARRLPDRGKLDALGEEVASLRWSLESDDSPQAVSRLEMRVNELARTIETTLTARQAKSEAIAVGMASSLADIRGALEDLVASRGAGPDMAAIPGLAASLSEIRSTLEDVTSRRMMSPDGATIADLAAEVAEIRDMLDARERTAAERETAAFGRLENRFDDISARLDNAFAQLPPPGLIDGLQDRLERLAEAIEALNLHAADPAVLEELREEIATIRREIAEREPPRLDDLESQIQDLATRMEQASRPEADAGQLGELEARITAIAAELDRATPRTEALVTLEENLLRLQAGLADGREESLEAARLAARDAVRDFAEKGADHELLEALRGDLDQISKAVEDTGERTNETIGSLQGSLASIVERLGRLEAEPAAEDAQATISATAAYGAVPEVRDAGVPSAGPVVKPPEEARVDAPRQEVRSVRADLAALRELTAGSADPERKSADRRADFIAAARRAAQAAVAEADIEAQVEETEAEPKASPFARIGHAIRNRKKPLLLAAAAIVLALGAFQVFGPHGSGARNTAAVKPTAVERPADTPKTVARAADRASAPTVPQVDEPALVAPPPNARAAMELANVATIDDRFSGAFQGGETLGAEAAPVPAHAVSATIPQDPKLPMVGSDRLRAAATEGDPAAAFEIANRFAEGRDVARDLAAAARWYRRAAEANLAVAEYRLGSLYERGQGVDKNIDEAVKWYQRAADQGNVGAMHNLAVMLSEGVGDGPDHAKAVEWFLAAANYGVKDSQYNLGVIYARGLGLDQDFAESYKWFAVAAAAGDGDAAARRDEVAGLLSPDELATARAAVQAWRAKPPLATANTVAVPEGGWGDGGKTVTAEDQKALVMKIQALLAEQGYDPGPADGIEGPKTREAVRAFQRRIGVADTGVIDGSLVVALDGGANG